MPIDSMDYLASLLIGDAEFKIISISEMPELPVSKYEDHEEDDIISSTRFKGGSIAFTVKAPDRFIEKALGIKRRYTRKKFTSRVIHLLKYGKSRRVRHKNWKRSFGKYEL